jgi:hypothetical protein
VNAAGGLGNDVEAAGGLGEGCRRAAGGLLERRRDAARS